MVGYNQNDSLTSNQKLISGCVSGVVTRFITQPLDVVKVRAQLMKKAHREPKQPFRITRAILREEGITAFWQGHALGQIHSILAVSSQFYVYELTTKYTNSLKLDPVYNPITSFVCGGIAGCCSAAIVIPLEVIRLRQMLVKSQYGGMFQAAKMIYTTGGLFAFYEGLSASLMQMGPSVGIGFSVFSFIQPIILDYMAVDCVGPNCQTSRVKHTPEALLMASTVAGSVAGFLSKSLTYPFDLAKKRLQISSHQENRDKYNVPTTSQNLVKCEKLLDCLRITFQREGLRGLYTGWKVTVYKAQLTSVIAFTSYEMMCYLLREYDVR